MPTDTDSRSREEYLREQVGLLADETRFEIVQALWQERRFDPISYAELKRRVGVRDSGRFNYHLDKLREIFVRKTDDGYALSASAGALYQVLLSMYPPVDSTSETLPVDGVGSCYQCGASLRAAYEDEYLSIRCTDCETPMTLYPFPPGAFGERSPEAALDAFERRTRHHLELAMEGVCPGCAGTIAVERVHDDVGRYPYDPVFVHRCQNCLAEWFVDPAWLVWDHPAVVSLLYDHEVDAREVPFWEVPRYISPDDVAIVGEEPLELELVVAVGDHRYTVLLDEELDVLSIDPCPE